MKNAMIDAFELKRKGYYKQAIEIYYKMLSSLGDDVEILSELADLYFLLKNNERAEHYVKKALDIEPNHVGSLTVMRNIYLSDFDFENAEKISKTIYGLTQSEIELEQLLDILDKQNKYEEMTEYTDKTTDTRCLYKVGYSLYKLKRYDEAVKLLESLTPEDISDKELILILLGKIYYEQQDMNKAKEVFKKLEENNLKNADSLNFIGMNKLDELKIDEALEYFSGAVEQDDKNPQYHYNMGQAYFLKGWFDEAQKCFNTAICLNPMEEKYHYSLAYLYYKSGDYETAEAHLNQDYFDSKVLSLVIKSEKGDLATPKVELEKMLKDYPNNETILYSLSKIYFNLDLYRQAKIMIDETIKVNPKSFEYQTFNVRLMLKLGLLKEAKDKINELLEKYPNFYYAHVLEAELHSVEKNYDALFDTAQDLIELDTNHYEGYYYNAVALFEKDDINFAIESLKKAISLDVNNADLYVKMSEFYQATGRYEDAFAYIKEASDIDKSAKNQELYMQLANILRKKGIQQE